MEVRRAVFVDRDGVINDLVPDPVSKRPESPLRPADVRLLPGVGPALTRLVRAGFLLIGVSNQPAAAKGTITMETLEATHDRVIELLDGAGVTFDDFRLCRHHPEGSVRELTGPCDCRKPAPGMLRDSARDLNVDLSASWMIGDTDADVQAGASAGCRTVLIEHPGSRHKRRNGAPEPDLVAPDVVAAAEVILSVDSL